MGTPGQLVGMLNPKISEVTVGTLAKVSSWMALRMLLVILRSILLKRNKLYFVIFLIKVYLSSAVFTTSPTSVDQPGIGIVFFHLISHHFSIDGGVKRQESSSITSREGRNRLFNTNLSKIMNNYLKIYI